jgi:hypothetical protein
MNKQSTVGELLSLLQHRAAISQTMVQEISALMFDESANGPRYVGVTDAAIEILRETGQPMHVRSQLIPALKAKGFAEPTPSNLVASLMRHGGIVRPYRGAVAYVEDKPANDLGDDV